jgi:hypothetical protein|tara:strand:- start:457 stop:831 length:375 start_codon:yes stop_codon:yes gene_type:complete
MVKKKGNPALVKGGPSLNPAGRPKGSVNKLTQMQNALIDQFTGEMNKEFKAVVRTIIREAKNGDMTAARLLMDRAIPSRKAVEHYGVQESGNIVINIKGLEDVNMIEAEDEPIVTTFEEIKDDE